MGKYDLGLAKRIISGAAKFSAEEESKVLAKLAEARAENLAPAVAKKNQKAYEILKSAENVRLGYENQSAGRNDAISGFLNGEVPRSAKSEEQVAEHAAAAEKAKQDLVKNHVDSMEAEKVQRMKQSVPEESTMAENTKKIQATDLRPVSKISSSIIGKNAPGLVDFGDKLSEYVPDFSSITMQNALKVKQKLAHKIVDLTSEPLLSNTRVPQSVKDDYSKGAETIVNEGLNPLNYVGGGPMGNAGAAAASAAYDIYNSRPTTSYVEQNPVNNPVQSFKVRP